MACGMTLVAAVPGRRRRHRPTGNPVIWELAAEIVVIAVLFATGLRIDDLGGRRLWRPTARLLAITMPLITIAAVAFLRWSIAGMTVAGAVLARGVPIFASTLIHGLTATATVEVLDRN